VAVVGLLEVAAALLAAVMAVARQPAAVAGGTVVSLVSQEPGFVTGLLPAAEPPPGVLPVPVPASMVARLVAVLWAEGLYLPAAWERRDHGCRLARHYAAESDEIPA
jgi:hypothetical protein